MNEEEILIKKIEELNSEYLNSKYYSLGKYVSYLINLLHKKKYLTFFRMIMLHFKNKKNKSNKNKTDIIFDSTKYVAKQNNDKKIVVYTCITGKYDSIEEPLIMESNCDYVLYTNNQDLKSDNWQIRDIPNSIATLEDNIKINRYIKMHPKELFEEYDNAIYIDGNIKIISRISDFINKIDNSTGLAIHRHCVNNCIYKEIKTCKAYGKGNYKKLHQQAKRYKQEGFPENFGMVECNVLVSNLKNDNQKVIFNGWWEEYLKSESLRDQIALPYVLWKNKFKIEQIGNLGNNVNLNKSIKINSHI